MITILQANAPAGGIYGVIADVDETTVLMRVDGDVKIRVDKNSITKDPRAEAAAQQNATVMPGAPAIPPNIPRGEDIASGRAEPRRANAADLPPLPQASSDVARAPAPTIRPMTLPDDPNEKAQDLARQEQDMLVLRQQMDQRLKELEGAEKRMQELIRDARSLEDQKVRSLIQMYANMKPRVAAKALENMDERVAVRILSGMAPKQSGEILTYTNPEKTAKFTEIITRMRTP